MSEPAEGDGSPPSSDTETLETALIESRRTFDKSVARLEDIDDKAMRSVRTAVLLAGLVASAISLGGPESVSQVGLLPVLTGAAGVVSLGASTVVGIGVYAATEYPFGVQSPHRPSVAGSERTYDAWLLALLDTYDTWIDELHIETTRTIGYLEFVQLHSESPSFPSSSRPE